MTSIRLDPVLARLRQFKLDVVAKRDDPPWSTRRLSISFTSPPRFVSAAEEESAACQTSDEEIANSVILPTRGWKIETSGLTSSTVSGFPYSIEPCDEEMYREHFYQSEHWNFYANDLEMGPVLLSLKQEATISREHFRILVRTPSHFVHGLLPASCLSANRYDLDDVVSALGRELDLAPKSLKRIQMESFGDELLKLDQSFIGFDHKVGVVYVKEGQTREDEILGNACGSPAFETFLHLLGNRVKLDGFQGYRGGLDTKYDMTGEETIYEEWSGHRVMFHVATLIPGGDEQQVQRKRHIGNDMVCVVFVEGAEPVFNPMAIRSHFLHSYIVVQCVKGFGNKDEDVLYKVSAVSRDGVPLFKPHLSHCDTFHHDSVFHDFLMAKIINAERACFRAPKFAELQNRTQFQIMQNIIIAAEDAESARKEGKNLKTAVGRRGSWLPVGFVRPPSPLGDVNQEKIENSEQLSLDLKAAYQNQDISDVICLIGKREFPIYGIKAILAARSKVMKSLLGSAQTLTRRMSLSRMQSQKEKNMIQRIVSQSVDEEDEEGSPRKSPGLKKKKTSIREKFKKKFQRRDTKSDVAVIPEVESTSVKIVAGKYLVPFPQFDINEFEVVMEFLHTGCCTLSPLLLPGVVCIAEFLEVPDLEQACFDFIHDSVDFKIIWDLLERLGHYLKFQSACSMFEKVVEFVDQNARDFLLSPEIKNLPQSIFQKIIKRSLNVEEVVKFKTCLLWANENCEPANWKEEVNGLVKDLDYFKISAVDLIKVVNPSGTVEKDVVMHALAYHADPKTMEPDVGSKNFPGTPVSQRKSSSREHSAEPNDSGIDANSIGSHASISGLGSLKSRRGGAGSGDLVVLPLADSKEVNSKDLTHL